MHTMSTSSCAVADFASGNGATVVLADLPDPTGPRGATLATVVERTGPLPICVGDVIVRVGSAVVRDASDAALKLASATTSSAGRTVKLRRSGLDLFALLPAHVPVKTELCPVLSPNPSEVAHLPPHSLPSLHYERTKRPELTAATTTTQTERNDPPHKETSKCKVPSLQPPSSA